MIKILLADDHPLVREGLRFILEPESDLEITAEAEDYDQLLRVASPRFDVVVTDISMPGVGIERAMRELSEQLPELPVVLVSMCKQDVLQERARRLGARGCVDKSKARVELAEAIRAVAGGMTYPPDKGVNRP